MEMFVKFRHFVTLSAFACFTIISLLIYCHWNEAGKYYSPKPSYSNAVLTNITKVNVGKDVRPPEAETRKIIPSSSTSPVIVITETVDSIAVPPKANEFKQWPTRSTIVTNVVKESVADVSMRKLINQFNEKQEILNEAKFGPFKATDNIILIQVHNRTDYFKLLINSMKQVRGINETLLIFSHDMYNNETNKLVQSIEYAKVMQIFYPNSTQLYPHTFPGDDPNDCPRDIKMEEAIQIKCNNALYPDSFDHYRESIYAQMKHHWWWKINYVFDYLRITQNYVGYLTIIEDDYYLLPDTIYVLDLMKKEAKYHDNIGLISLGYRESSFEFSDIRIGDIEIVEDVHFHSITMNKELWNRLKKCAKKFCERDEYHWDWSFYHITTQCLYPPPLTLEIAVPRVYHIGDCGMHRSKENCFETFERVSLFLNESQHHLFPKKFNVMPGHFYIRTDGVGPWGGFSDPRDHSLCLSFVKY